MTSSKRRRCYHVVCRDCRTERVYHSASAAESFADEHGEKTDHAVTFGRVE